MVPEPPARSLARVAPWLAFLGTLGVTQFYDLYAQLLSPDGDLIAYALLPIGYLVVLFLVLRASGWKASDLGFVAHADYRMILGVSAVASLLFVATLLEPGLFYGFSILPRQGPFALGVLLFSAPLIAVSEEGLFRGFILRSMAGSRSLRFALVASSVLFAANATNWYVLATIAPSTQVEYFFLTFLANLVLGVILGLYFFLGKWSLVGPVSLRTVLILLSTVFPLAALVPDWETEFYLLLVGYAVIAVVVFVAIPRPRMLARRYLMESGDRARRD
ncbi:MAG: CPBP family intramembrane glutamic endopeptidase, partial [Thermoplasmata archaeon]